MMWASLAKGATAIPWKKVIPIAVVAGEALREWAQKRSEAASTPGSRNDPVSLAKRLEKLEQDSAQLAEAFEKTTADNARVLKELVTASEILAARVTWALVLGAIASLISITTLVIVLLRH